MLRNHQTELQQHLLIIRTEFNQVVLVRYGQNWVSIAPNKLIAFWRGFLEVESHLFNLEESWELPGSDLRLQNMEVSDQDIPSKDKVPLRLNLKAGFRIQDPLRVKNGLSDISGFLYKILQHRLKSQPQRPAIEVIRDYGNLPQIECYAGQINQVLMNILVNAINALDEANAKRTDEEIKANPSQINICTSVSDSQLVEIAIADNALGMPSEVKNCVFNPFFTTKSVGTGTGMGMAISYQIITEKHGGKLECFSTLGKGSQFIIKLPMGQQAKSSAPKLDAKN